ncbi:SGNH/GDSL hydrolase family protein [Hyphococcus luteus]|uniref:SGNH/GDSL hydrolase family protein n=1 Tax=Hyphococcus luteus TaxID=2058213 RepID=A0A2S7K0G4_9PROT|nr:hypothetical protein [Marinicaulis flavus]PQA86000.1 hypothetical protein CW354_16605 [Marinicaulis flavus]
MANMFRIFWFALILMAPLSGSGHAEGKDGPAAQAPGPVRILFIGNSLTHFNDLPTVLEQVANHDGAIRAQTAMIARDGATLEQHWREGKAGKAIGEARWDYVVLQEQSQLGARIVDGVRKMNAPDAFYETARAFDREIHESGAQTVFLLTWSHKDKPEEQALLDEAYETIADELDAVLAPAGAAWRLMRESESGIELYYDNVHPNFNGAYLSALVTGMTLIPDFPKDGGGVLTFVIAAEEPPASVFETVEIAPDTAEQLQEAAQTVMQNRP